MANTGFYIGGADMAANWPDKSYLIDRYPELANTLKQAGLWVWGNNNYGQLGINDRTNRSSPIQTVASGANWKLVACGYTHTAAIKTDGTLWTWGQNTYGGALGTNDITNYSSPVQTVAGGTNWKLVACGRYNTAAIKTDGTLWTWGNGANGQLGNNNNSNGTGTFSSPAQTVSAGTNWKSVACGQLHMSAIKTDGTLWTWGYNYYGQLGDATSTDKSSPVQTVAGGTDWKQVACGALHSAAIKTNGTLWLWGQNNYGVLGDNTTTNRSSPVQTIASGTDWKQVACGREPITAAIKTDGTLWTWGQNTYGQLGDNTTTSRSSPVQTIAGGTDWKQVAAAIQAVAAIKTDGTLWVFGLSGSGALGTNNTSRYSSPVQTVAGGTNWKSIAGGGYPHFAAIRDNTNDLI